MKEAPSTHVDINWSQRNESYHVIQHPVYVPPALVYTTAGQLIILSVQEDALFSLLADNVNQIVSQADVASCIWPDDSPDWDYHEALYGVKRRFMCKIKPLREDGVEIQTIRGIGYILTGQVLLADEYYPHPCEPGKGRAVIYEK